MDKIDMSTKTTSEPLEHATEAPVHYRLYRKRFVGCFAMARDTLTLPVSPCQPPLYISASSTLLAE